MDMLRAATEIDLEAIVTLGHDEEVSWFGAAENGRDEIAEYVAFHGGVDTGVVVQGAAGIRGFAAISPDGDALLILDPADPEPAYQPLVAWLRSHGASRLEAHPSDARRITWLESRGWTHSRSNFDLTRPGSGKVESPMWPAGVAVAPYCQGIDDAAVHELIYADAGYATVPGHVARSLETWRLMFTSDFRGWVARRDGRPIGWVIGRVSVDCHGWVHQIAVARAEQRAGLGRALLLCALDDLLSVGATSLGLNVRATNDRAISLYRSVGLSVEKEWRVYETRATH